MYSIYTKVKKKRLNICFSANLIKDGVNFSMLLCFHFSIFVLFQKVKNSANHLSLLIFAIFLVLKSSTKTVIKLCYS